MRSVVWGSSVALSWMWGLGLFFSVNFTFLYGWVGLLCFAIPNALSLVIFGWIAERRSRKVALKTFVESAFVRHAGLFSLYQITAIGLTLFALIAYFMVPLGSSSAIFTALAILAIGVFSGELAGIGRLVKLHAAYLVAALVAVVLLVMNSPSVDIVPQKGGLTTFAGLLLPMTVGLLLGPVYDIQQWQRAVEMQRRNIPIALSFAVGGAIFFGLLILNGIVAMQVTGGLTAADFIGRDGIVHAQSAITRMLSEGGGLPLVYYSVWVLLCLLATFDSAQSALSWFLPTVVNASENALVRMVPERLLKSTLPAFILASAAAVTVWVVGGHLEYFMIVYASLFVPYSAIMIRDLWDGSKTTEITSTTLFAGLASLLVMSSGYLNGIPLLMAAAALVALLPLAIETRRMNSQSGAEADRIREVSVAETPQSSASPFSPSDRSEGVLPVVNPDGRFDGKWFEIKLTATYSDTNSVGNVYFANYVAWVGKARELFFRHCMPDFDLKKTPFYILTRSFNHKFVREAREFEEIIVRLRIKTYNRKFVKLEHQLFNSSRELLGEGEQSLMFVTVDNYSLTDIPPDVVVAFTPHV